MFSKNKTQKNSTTDQIINEFEPYGYAVKIKVVKEGKIIDSNGFKLKELNVADDGETTIQLTLF